MGSPDRAGRAGLLAAYGVMVAGGVGAFFLIRGYGASLDAPPPPGGAATFGTAAAGGSHVLLHVLGALAAVVVAGHVLGRLFRMIGQPAVIGEVVAGILLGPSLIGAEASSFILPAATAPYLGVIAQLGGVLYMFLVGLDLNAGLLRRQGPATIFISHASIVVPFTLGAILAVGLYPRLSTSDVPFTSFALFMGVAMSITAFPVLARILADRGMSRSELGVMALTCAASGDVTAWCLLAFVVGVAQAQVGEGLMVSALAVGFILAMFVLVRPVMERLAARWGTTRPPGGAVAAVIALVLLSALATELIGIHAIFGAFLLGAVIPSESGIARLLTRQLGTLVTVLLLPAFFAFTGMRTRIDLISGWGPWLLCGLIILIATAGKFGGTYAMARIARLPRRESAALGTLMNTRGLMELIVLNIGLDLGVISPVLFAMLVIMAVATTMATAPVLRLILPPVAAGRDDGAGV